MAKTDVRGTTTELLLQKGCVAIVRLPIAWHTFSGVFLVPHMDFYCNGTEITDPGKTTKNYCPCDNPWWDRREFTETSQTKFGMYCDRAWLKGFSGSMTHVGGACGSLAFGVLADRFGRLHMLTASTLFLMMFGLLASLMPSIVPFIFMRWCQGLGVGGSLVTSYVLIVEYCGINCRGQISALFHLPANFGYMTISWISYYFRNYDEFLMAISIPIYMWFIIQFTIQESPKWLLDTGQIDKCNKAAEIMCKFNMESPDALKAAIQSYQVGRTQEKELFWQIFGIRSLTVNFLRMCMVFFISAMGFYGTTHFIGRMSEYFHLNLAINGATLIISSVLATILVNILSRKSFLMASNLMASSIMLIIILMPSDIGLPRVILACICNCFNYMSLIVAYLYGVELFPTSVRTAALGCLSFFARSGQMTAPLVHKLGPSAGIIYTILPVIGALLVVPLPETKGKPLPESFLSMMEDDSS